MTNTPRIRTCLWFDGQAEEAVDYYVSLLSNSRIESVMRPEPEGAALLVEFTLAGTPYQALNGGPQFKFTPAASISVLTVDQKETDRMWEALAGNGGEEQPCGWLVDRFGLSWQIVPEPVLAMLYSEDRAAVSRLFAALKMMKKIEIAQLEAAFRNEGERE